MSDDHWYRNQDWSDEIEAQFEARLARSRSQRAQYLRIQGSLLKDRHPAKAVELLGRCIATGEASYVAHAHAEIAHAHYRLGDVEAALAALQAAMQQEAREPMFRTNAALDYAFLVALHGMSERYDLALAALDAAGEGFLPTMLFEAAAARALIHAARGEMELAKGAAIRALKAAGETEGPIPGFPDVGIVPDSGQPLSSRLTAIALA